MTHASIFSLAFMSLLLVSCSKCHEDPIDRNWVAPNSATTWQPPHSYQPRPCHALSDPNEFLSFLQHAEVAIVDLVDVALRNNPTTQRTWSEARAAAYGVGVAKSALYPTIDFQETLNYRETHPDNEEKRNSTTTVIADAAADDVNNDVNKDVVPPNGATNGIVANSSPLVYSTVAASNLSVSYLLLDFGGRAATIEAAKQALYESNWFHNRQIQQVVFATLQNYYIYVGTKALLESREADLKNAQTNYDAANQLFQAGIRNKLDVLQAQSDLVNIEANIAQLKGELKTAYGNLANALGLHADVDFHIPKFPSDAALDRICTALEDLVQIALKERPDLAAAYAEHERLKAEVVVARSQGMPTLAANANFQESVYFHNPSFNNHTLSGVLALNVPIFSGFLYVNQVKQAKELVRAACANIRIVENQVSLDVVTAHANLQTAIESLHYNLEFLKYSQEAYTAALMTYEAGISTILDLLLANRNLAAAKAQTIEARTNWVIALANVSYAMGIVGTPYENAIKCRR
jgi:outer membrane protein TolC